jgi:hypothetical protein
MEHKPHLITFSSSGYPSPERFLNQAKDSGFFSSVLVYSNEHIRGLILARPFFFMLWKKRGFGFWLWKPRLILKRLREIPEDDFLVYLDQGVHIQSAGSPILQGYLNQMMNSRSCIGVFSAGEHYRPEHFVRRQAVENYNPEFYEGGFGAYVYAGILLIRNNEEARTLIQEWQQMCEDTPLLGPIPIRWCQRKEFIGQDGDNGYLPVVLDKHGGYLKFAPEEVNLLDGEGIQLHHLLPQAQWKELDWGKMRDRPFLIKRDR